MKNRYEALLTLDIQGSEDGVKEIIERLQGEFDKEGAKVEEVQKMGKRPFAYASQHRDSGYFANFIFTAEPTVIEKLKAKFKLDGEIHQQTYRKLAPKKVEKSA